MYRSRRRFLQAGCTALGLGGLHTLWPQLELIPTAAAQSTPSGYRALVCIFLNGGNDSWNLLIPGDAERHERYKTARSGLFNAQTGAGLAIPRPDGDGVVAGQTLPAALSIAGGNYGVNPFCPELAQLYNENKLAFLSNIGPLVEPVTRATAGLRRLPPQLYSHSDQTNLWQIGSGSNANAAQGWGGQIAGRVALPATSTAGLPPVISIAGQTRFLVGNAPGGAALLPYTLSTSSTTPASTISNYAASGGSATQFQPQRRAALQELLALNNPQPFTAEYRTVFQRAIALAEQVINPAIQAIPTTDPINGGGSIGFTWPNTGLANQLRQVARIIRISRNTAGFTSNIAANRQVFFVSIGGFDTHADQITSPTQALAHHGLLQQVSQAVFAFQRAMAAMGADQDVTLFTISEFARTLNSNGDGTDHAWGGVQFAVGGAVNGGQIIGRYPSMVLDNTLTGATSIAANQGESYSRGQFIPTIAVDQFAATCARWMGVADSELPVLFPNIDNFANGPHANAGATPSFAVFGRTLPNLLAGV